MVFEINNRVFAIPINALNILFFCLIHFPVTAQLQFDNQAPALGIFHNYEGSIGGGISFVDFNQDGLDDLTLATGIDEPIQFYQNNGTSFNLIPPLVPNTDQVKHILWVDFDNDADLDLYIASHDSPNRLYENKGNLSFEDITAAAGLPLSESNTYGVCWGDIDRDGWLDIYYHERIPFMSIENRFFLFRNNADGTFTDITATAQTNVGGSAPFCSSFIDYNNDNWPDIYTAHDKINNPNVLLENNGDGTFSDVSAQSNADLEMDAMCVNPGDYNNDGWIDIYITNTPSGGSALLQNTGPLGGGIVKFGNSAQFAGVSFPDRTGWGSVFLDADNDGFLDLYATAANYGNIAQSNAFFLNAGNQTFTQPNAGFDGDTTITYNTAIGDYNKDGYPDIAVIAQVPFMTHFWKNSGGTNNWLKIDLTGVLSNRDAIGSKIEIFHEGHYQMRYTLCGNGFLGQNTQTEMFGLKNSETVDSVIVTWPTGHLDKLFQVKANQCLELTEGSTTNGDIEVDEDISLTMPPPNTVTDHQVADLSITPNPVTDFIQVKQEHRIQSYYIIDIKGQLLHYNTIQANTFQINASSYLPGVYYLICIDEKGRKKMSQWVKK